MNKGSKKILITGGTGLVGARLLPRLADAGWDCHALIREGKQAPANVTFTKGDLLDPQTLIEAVKGASAIIHLAAVFRTADTDLIWKSNLEATQNLLDATKKYAPD
ncbi:NAD-dependent epimerase/dehydratase family protein, partial [Dyadobacter sp.]|uniref:NAD-dependent epimerase/dehydratase family protein n=1 Tax=Dyadobacter sp. TaxID=1914288 RepID=UPI003F6F4C56